VRDEERTPGALGCRALPSVPGSELGSGRLVGEAQGRRLHPRSAQRCSLGAPVRPRLGSSVGEAQSPGHRNVGGPEAPLAWGRWFTETLNAGGTWGKRDRS